MTKLENMSLLDILPARISDEEMEALAYAIDPEMQEITAAIIEAIIMPRIKEQHEDLVDLLAWQLHVDFYEPLGLDLDTKRALAQNSLLWHRYKGTKYALVDMIRTLFFEAENFKIEEWFEYGGRPYFFRLVAWEALAEMERYNDLIRAIYELKNERSWLDGLIFHRELQGTVYIGMVGRHTRRFHIGGTLPTSSEVAPITFHIGNVGKQTSRYTIPGEAVVMEVGDVIINTGLISKRTSKIFIGSSEEVGI